MNKKILLILILGIISFSSCKNEKKDEALAENNTERKLEPIEVVKLFITSLGNRDFQTAYNLENVESWGTYEQFSSTKAFGGINATAINEIKKIEQDEKNAKIYVDAYYYDPVNGNNRFQQFFYLSNINGQWKIVKLKQTTNKTPEEQINKILSKYTFYGNNVNQKKNKNTIYSYDLPNFDKVYIVFTTNDDAFAGHFGYSYMSVFIFDKVNQIKNKFIKVDKISSNFGNFAPDKKSVSIQTFDNNFFILVDWGYTQYGITETFTNLYYINSSKLMNVGKIQTHFDNTGLYTWDDKEVEDWSAVNIDFIKSNNSTLPDISVLIGRDSYNDAGQNFYKTYYFNGTTYVEK